MSLHEESGVFGIYAAQPVNAAAICYYGMCALQHRGQESCGIVVNDDGVFFSHKDLGLVNEVFTREVIASFPAGAIFHTTSDTETIAYIVTKERLSLPSIEEGLSRAMNTLEGAYSLVLMSSQKLICARDPHGFRPLCYGKTAEGTYIVASESCALHAVGAELIRDMRRDRFEQHLSDV